MQPRPQILVPDEGYQNPSCMTGVTNKGHDRCWKQIEALFTTSDSVGALSEMCVLQFK